MSRAPNPDPEQLAALFCAVDDALCEDDVPLAHRRLAEARSIVGVDDPRVHYYQGCLRWNEDGPMAALGSLVRAVEADGAFADAHHLLGLVYEQLGDLPAQCRHFLAAHDLDERDDRAAGVGTPAQLDVIERTAARVLDDMPSRFGELLARVPVVIEARPHRDLVAEGFDPRALGLFEGRPQGEGPSVGVEDLGVDLVPSRIVLFATNLLTEFDDEAELAEEIETTILHEVGHFFGLDEDEVAELGLA